MTTSSDRLNHLRHEVGPAASGRLHDAADVLRPWAEAAGHGLGAAAEGLTALTHETVAKGAPLAQQAFEQGAPRVRQAVDTATPYLQRATDKVTSTAQQAADKVSGSARVQGALAAAAPALNSIREHTSITELSATEPVIAKPPKKRGRGLAVVGVLAGVAAAAYLIGRRLLGDRGSQWQTARPSAPYVPAPKTGAERSGPGAEPVDHESPLDQSADNVSDTTDVDSPVPSAAYASATADESSPADAASAGEDAPVSTSEDNSAGVGPSAHPGIWSDRGAYVGTEPPPSFTIKANERSMKYHLPESSGYTRTLSEIWFDSEEKAQAAGFVRAQR